jgi:putative transposase
VKWPTAYDFGNLCVGVAKDLGIHSDTIMMICRQFATARQAQRKCPKFRASGGPRRALGWVPFKGRNLRFHGDAVILLRRRYRMWKSRDIPDDITSGSFSQDARGRWYFNIGVEVPDIEAQPGAEIGIDLGLKTLAVCSDGESIPARRHYRRHEAALRRAARANNRRRVRAINAKIANCRRDHLHKVTTRLVRANQRIVVGNVSASKLAKTTMAKSVLDAGWHSFRTMLAYKAIRHGVEYIEANEAFTTQTCSDCGSIGGPKGIAGLEIRRWTCGECGADHDRDLNSARNILRVGAERRPPVEEIPAKGRTLTAPDGQVPPPDFFTRANC